MICDRTGDYEALRAKVMASSIIPRAGDGLVRHGMAAWLNMVTPAPPLSVVMPAIVDGLPVVFASIFLRLARGAIHA